MTAVHLPGAPGVERNELISTNPADGREVGPVPGRRPDGGRAGRGAGTRRRRLVVRARLRRPAAAPAAWRALIASRIARAGRLMPRRGRQAGRRRDRWRSSPRSSTSTGRRGTPSRVLGARRVRSRLLLAEFSGHLEYQPYGVIGVIGPWNYPILTPIGSIAYALAAGNAVVFKPSEYTPAIGQWLVDTLRRDRARATPVLQVVHGLGDTAPRCAAPASDKIAFTGSTATAKKVMAACAETLTPVLLECGGKDAMIVDADADLDAAAEACVWGALTNAGQTCIGIERVYAVDAGATTPSSPSWSSARPAAARRPGRATSARSPCPARSTSSGGTSTTRSPAAAGRCSVAPTRSGRRTCTRPSWSTCRRTPRRSRGDVRPDPDRQPGAATPTRRSSVPTRSPTAWAVRSSAGAGRWRSPGGCAPA